MGQVPEGQTEEAALGRDLEWQGLVPLPRGPKGLPPPQGRQQLEEPSSCFVGGVERGCLSELFHKQGPHQVEGAGARRSLRLLGES